MDGMVQGVYGGVSNQKLRTVFFGSSTLVGKAGIG
jgi:hypothetical protein